MRIAGDYVAASWRKDQDRKQAEAQRQAQLAALGLRALELLDQVGPGEAFPPDLHWCNAHLNLMAEYHALKEQENG